MDKDQECVLHLLKVFALYQEIQLHHLTYAVPNRLSLKTTNSNTLTENQ